MKRFLLAFSMCSLLMTPPVFASGGGGGDGSSSNGNRVTINWNQGEEDAADAHQSMMEDLGVDEGSPRVVTLPAIVVPLVVDDRLEGYAYIHARLLVAEGRNSSRIVEQTHFALDRLIRASHRVNLTAESGDTVDVERLREVWMQALSDHFGPGVIQRLAIMTPDTRLMN
jgi:hypothetical protein